MAQRILRELMRDVRGNVDAAGYVILVTILGIGIITGLATLRDGIVQEYGDIALALEHIDQSFTMALPDGMGGLKIIVFDDETNLVPDDVAGAPPPGISLSSTPAPGTGETAPPLVMGAGMPGEGP